MFTDRPNLDDIDGGQDENEDEDEDEDGEGEKEWADGECTRRQGG